MKNKIALVMFAALAAVLLTGCATAVLSSLHGKLPIESADSLKVTASISLVGGGTLEVQKFTTDPITEQVTAGTYHETVNTGTGALVIDGSNVKLKRVK